MTMQYGLILLDGIGTRQPQWLTGCSWRVQSSGGARRWRLARSTHEDDDIERVRGGSGAPGSGLDWARQQAQLCLLGFFLFF
jgi:hypothetical protein